MSKSEPLAHIARSPLPWRDPADNDTECGKPVSSFAKVITAAEAVKMSEDMGIQRASLFLCMTCVDSLRRHWYRHGTPQMTMRGQVSFDSDPTERLSREFGTRRDQVDRELRAMAEIVARHRQEFDDIMSGLVTPIADLKRKRGAAR